CRCGGVEPDHECIAPKGAMAGCVHERKLDIICFPGDIRISCRFYGDSLRIDRWHIDNARPRKAGGVEQRGPGAIQLENEYVPIAQLIAHRWKIIREGMSGDVRI